MSNNVSYILGTLDGVPVPKLSNETSIEGAGTYVNEIKFSQPTGGSYALGTPLRGVFKRWDGDSWVKIDADAAAILFKQKDKYEPNTNNPKKYKALTSYTSASAIRYPKDIASGKSSDYVTFDFYDYQPPFSANKKMSVFDLDGTGGLKKKNGGTTLITNETLTQYNQTAESAEYYNADTAVYPQIMLYTPPNISTTFGAEWEGKSFGSIATGILQSASADNLVESVKRLSGVGANAIQKAPAEAAASLITNLAKGVTGDTITQGDVFGGIAGVVRNPNTELMFQKMKLRTFELNFKLIPYNINETNDIRRICQIFKRAMLPTYSLEGAQVLNQNKETSESENRAIEAAFIKIPKVVKVTFRRGDSVNEFLPKYKMCAITDVQINYTPDGNYAVYGDVGAPVAVEIKINFMETKLVFAEEIDLAEGDLLKSTDIVEQTNDNTDNNGMYMRSSDLRLKENITKVGNSPSGINIYEWNYKSAPDTRYRGVMAHEILNTHPEAVALQPDGYMSVLYGRIDVNMEMIK